jgi:hypothetical protein
MLRKLTRVVSTNARVGAYVRSRLSCRARVFACPSGVARFTESGQVNQMCSCGLEMRVVNLGLVGLLPASLLHHARGEMRSRHLVNLVNLVVS